MPTGRVFHDTGPDEQKARGPSVTVRVLGTRSWKPSAERRCDRRNLHVILHQATEFRPNQSTHCENMTSYLFLKMTAATAKYYFRFRMC